MLHTVLGALDTLARKGKALEHLVTPTVPLGETVGGFRANTAPFGLVYFGDSLWTTGGDEGLITRYDPDTGSVLAEIKVSTDASGISAGD